MRRLLAALALLPLPALANDGWGGLSATGLTFGQTEAVAMVSEDLFISPDRIAVDYTFRNVTAQNVTGEVIFPLPPINLMSLEMSSWNLPEDRSRTDLLNFRATVDGKRQKVGIDHVAVVEDPDAWKRPASVQYDTPGRDISALLTRMGIPLTLDVEEIRAVLARLPRSQIQQLRDAGLIAQSPWDDADPVPMPAWSVVLRYHWTQTFPAGKETRVRHEYENYPEGSVFTFEWPAKEDYQRSLADSYCIDGPTGRKIMSTLKAGDSDGEHGYWGAAYYLRYVLRTANSWAGPIGRFHLVLDKGDPVNALSVCMPGLKKVSPTRFEVTKTDWTPPEDLAILLVAPRISE
ncbi:DUF4424 family protein [Neotabrizicola shimadae]|uniref:DUF4424 family protein n=1 Tax=Neotabrizicola shimadae TaxID=2807096 RepID=A0A8G0ZW03_9RHOB|nr:DUF4424 family protein [Neotabrizicola shimadae]QYZ69892.1 DUF4424 family protein [Neotabrizicola shimadae]